MEQISTIGLDVAKNVFQVHGIDENGGVVVQRQLKRRRILTFFAKLPSCLVGMEACASLHHWAREAVTRPTMRFVPVKAPEQQGFGWKRWSRQWLFSNSGLDV